MLDDTEVAQLLLDLQSVESSIDVSNNNVVDDSATQDKSPHNENQLVDRASRILQLKKKSQFQDQNFNLRLKGQEYCGYQSQEQAQKSERQLGPRCLPSSRCLKTKDIHCAEVTEEDRIEFFKSFWALDTWQAKKIMVKGLVEKKDPKITDYTAKSPRDNTFVYYLPLKDGRRVRVCSKAFLSATDVPQSTILGWLKDKKRKSDPTEEEPPVVVAKKTRRMKESEKREKCSGFIDRLAKVESHYCRSCDSKLYIEANWSSLRELHR
jgi:hypothetical protein